MANVDQIGEQQRRLVDTLLLSCKSLETCFARLDASDAKGQVLAEIKRLEQENAEKDQLLDEISKELGALLV